MFSFSFSFVCFSIFFSCLSFFQLSIQRGVFFFFFFFFSPFLSFPQIGNLFQREQQLFSLVNKFSNDNTHKRTIHIFLCTDFASNFSP
ncbi:hypothetical protein DM02DRAFT_155883 [Periconia macrospinosa]|uniref:Uncharacterized protein n=1 Tax=Periconia macrospinosa TaxID=97972 RepID=A0A2V1EDU2_9PLEO|nr:hypothetical protein DM02DRAFT_155883 [Periconia macrospinosa]